MSLNQDRGAPLSQLCFNRWKICRIGGRIGFPIGSMRLQNESNLSNTSRMRNCLVLVELCDDGGFSYDI